MRGDIYERQWKNVSDHYQNWKNNSWKCRVNDYGKKIFTIMDTIKTKNDALLNCRHDDPDIAMYCKLKLKYG